MYKKPSFLLAFFLLLMIHSLIFSQTILRKYDGSIEAWSAVQPTSGSNDFFAVRYQIPAGVTAPYTVLEIKFNNNKSGTIWPQVMLTHANGSNQPDLNNPISLFTNETPTVTRETHTIVVNAVVNTLDDLFFVIKFPEGEIFSPQGGPGLGTDTSEDPLMPGNLFSTDGVTFQEILIFNLGVDVIIDADASPILFRVARATGDVFTDGSFIPSGADLAEHIKVSEPVEPGDVVELDPGKPEHYRKARGPSQLIAGIITTRPGFILGNHPNKLDSVEMAVAKRDLQSETNQPMLALMGRVPVKVTTENGAIKPGDLLTVSKKPGYAMRCSGAKKCQGAIIGKALAALESGEGLIEVLVMSH